MSDVQDFSEQEKKEIFYLVEKISGTRKVSNDKPHIFLNNIKRRMIEVKISNLQDYLSFARKNADEYNHLVSSLTIHTTYWFREPRHFTHVENEVQENFKNKKIRALSLGCSTGEEVYSLALTLEKFRVVYPSFDYQIFGFDIDGISVGKAKRCLYKADNIQKIPQELRHNVLIGSGKTEGIMTLSKDIRSRCHFEVVNALKVQQEDIGKFDIIFCRNMLIYFSNEQVQMIVRNLVKKASVGSLFCVGHSEDISYYTRDLERITGSTYRRHRESEEASNSSILIPKDKTLVLSVTKDDSITYALQRIVEGADCVLQTESDFKKAEEILKNEQTGVMFLDMDHSPEAASWMVEKRKAGEDTPCVLLAKSSVSSHSSIDLLNSYAQDVFLKDALIEQSDKFSEKITSLFKSKQILKRKPKEPVLVVDDDEDVLEMFCDVIESQNFTTKAFLNPEEALAFLQENLVHCVVTDYRMPQMTGEIFAKKIKECRSNIPVVMVTGFNMNAQTLEKDGTLFRFLEKPVPTEKLSTVLHDATRAKYTGELTHLDEKLSKGKSLIVIGSSTGGPHVLQSILKDISNPNLPPMVLVQHIQKNFQQSFSENIAKASGLELCIVDKEMPLSKGKIYLASPDHHVKIRRRDGQWYAYKDDTSLFKGHRPCVEHLFQSTAETGEKDVMGILLTGMGDDGAKGMLDLYKVGAYTIAQDLKSSIVFGMPRVAIDMGGATFVGDIPEIRRAILATMK